MKSDEAFDAWLTSQLNEPTLPDQDFTRGVTARMESHRRRRLSVLIVAMVVVGVLVAIALHLAPAPLFSLADVTPETIVAMLILVTACSLAWIGTESRTLKLTPPFESRT